MNKSAVLKFCKINFQKIKDYIKNRKILYDIEAIFLLFVPILITLDEHVKFVGTILTGIPFFVGILSVLCYQRNKRIWIKYAIITLLFVINVRFFLESSFDGQFEFIKQLIIFLTCFDMVQDKDFLKTIKNYFEKYNKFITISLIGIIILNIFANNYSTTWKMNAFQGIYVDPHQAAYRCCTLIVYTMFLVKAQKNNKILNIILLFACEWLLMRTGARTPTLLGIALGMIEIYFMKDEMLKFYNEHKKVSIIAVIVFIIAMILYLPRTAFMQKIFISSEGTFDNGRSILREADWKYFIESPIQNKLFGHDNEAIRQVNFEVMWARIWCHSDIMQILLQFGIFMLIIYFETWIRALIFHLKGEKKFDKFIIIMLNLVYLFVAFYNGFFFYPRFIISIPIIFALYKVYNQEEKVEVKQIEGETNL